MSQPKSSRVSSLDGLRAVSIALVLFGHAAGASRFPGGPDAFRHVVPGAFATLGVMVFFVISGFIITTLLLKELKSGRTNLTPCVLRSPSDAAVACAIRISRHDGHHSVRDS